MADYLGKDTPKLGFGLMRLPKRGPIIDIPQTEQMVDRFLEAGFTYFDTAYVYTGSEAAAKKALVDRHPRDSFTLASKVNVSAAPTEKMAKRQLFTSLKRAGVEYFDFYLLHAIMEKNAEKFDRFGLWDFVQEQKQKGLVRHMGFSFHGGPALLDKLLTDHPEVEFVQLQINYADWEDASVQSRANYEVVRRHGRAVVIMEPVKGGHLAQPPAAVTELFTAHAPTASPASWAIRFAASLEGVMTVLSGMSSTAQMEDNLSYMGRFRPLDDEERQIIRLAQQILGKSQAIPCTACHYCTKGCPRQIPIPEIFAAANLHLAGGQTEQARTAYLQAAAQGHRASDCIACGQCEGVCPQHLPVIEELKSCAKILE